MGKDLTINGNSAWDTWGVYLDDSSIGQLLCPPPLKDYVTSTSRTENGTRVVTEAPVFVAERDLTIQLGIYGKDEGTFLGHVASFTEMLTTSKEIVISAAGVTCRCIYKSCNQFSSYQRGIGKFVLRLTEYNPASR